GVAIHAQDRGRDLSAGLAHDELPCRLAFRALHLYVPEPGDRRDVGGIGGGRRESVRLEWIPGAAGAAGVLTPEPSIPEGRVDLRLVLIEAEDQRAVLEAPGGRCHLLVAVEERPLHGGAGSRQLEPERDDDFVDGDGPVPQTGERL